MAKLQETYSEPCKTSKMEHFTRFFGCHLKHKVITFSL